jgi:hypothetical protein
LAIIAIIVPGCPLQPTRAAHKLALAMIEIYRMEIKIIEWWAQKRKNCESGDKSELNHISILSGRWTKIKHKM